MPNSNYLTIADLPVAGKDQGVTKTLLFGGRQQREVASGSMPDGASNSSIRSWAEEQDVHVGQARKGPRIRGSTAAQSNPPLPQPRGGMAIDLTPSRRTSSIRASSPASMSAIRDLPFQCRFVGKLMTYRREQSALTSCPSPGNGRGEESALTPASIPACHRWQTGEGSEPPFWQAALRCTGVPFLFWQPRLAERKTPPHQGSDASRRKPLLYG